MRVRQHVHRLHIELNGDGSGVIHKDERSDHAAHAERQDAFDVHTGSERCFACVDDDVEHRLKLAIVGAGKYVTDFIADSGLLLNHASSLIKYFDHTKPSIGRNCYHEY